LRLFRSSWGLTGLKHREALLPTLRNIRSSGFDGLEASLADIGDTLAEREHLVATARDEGLQLILSAYSSWPNYEGPFDAQTDVAGHVRQFMGDIREICHLHATHGGASPIVGVNGHSGTDMWDEAQALHYFGSVDEQVRALGEGAVPRLSHETHRGRILCCPFTSARLLAALPSLQITSDFSHWVVKSERLLDTPEETALLKDTVAPAVVHLHARVGTAQAPQVGALNSPHCAAAQARFVDFWKEVWSARLRNECEEVTACVEYGPPEFGDDGSYLGYPPIDRKGATDFTHDEILEQASVMLRDSFSQWTRTSAPL